MIDFSWNEDILTLSEYCGLNDILHQHFHISILILCHLHSLGASIFRISIIGTPTFRIKLWACKSGVWREFKNSMGYCSVSSSLRMQSIDL
ncbi:hypothetical protein TNIN_414771 [Trichonephila inaurata madagascariensis]|uniref:Uncharacterized protein n=1 Tax=Trichonephila inaurata madagascariensis TaxID=2747483 RepID=A0A8X6YKG6_9ARAC|nr:hypothetical protein TNIN_414771 [Trichonephila inaurata madagascariensis]